MKRKETIREVAERVLKKYGPLIPDADTSKLDRPVTSSQLELMKRIRRLRGQPTDDLDQQFGNTDQKK